MSDVAVFEGISKAIARDRKTAQWVRIGTEERVMIYEAVHPGLVACRIYVYQEGQARAERETARIGKRQLGVGVAVSREITRDKYRVHAHLCRYGARYDFDMDKLLPLPYYDTESHHDGPGAKVEDMVDDFRLAFPWNSTLFQGAGAFSSAAVRQSRKLCQAGAPVQEGSSLDRFRQKVLS